MNVLLLVDIQNDFVPGGTLAVPNGNEVVPVANRLIEHFTAKGDLIVATQDWHPENHESFVSLWPDHCVQHTSGADFVPGLNVSAVNVVVKKGTDPTIDSYSGFFDNARRKQTDLAGILRQAGVETVYILGLATEYCVKFTALDAHSLGFRTVVVLDGCRGINIQPGDEPRAVDEMAEIGIATASSEDVLKGVF